MSSDEDQTISMSTVISGTTQFFPTFLSFDREKGTVT